MHENSGYLPHPMRENQMNFHFQVPRVESLPDGTSIGDAKFLSRDQRSRRSHSGMHKFENGDCNRNSLQRRSFHGRVSANEFTYDENGLKKPRIFLSDNTSIINGIVNGSVQIDELLKNKGMANGSNRAGSGGHLSAHSNTTEARSNGDNSDPEDSFHDGHIQEHAKSFLHKQISKDNMEAWWTIGEFLEGRQVTHQSAKFTLTGNRVFGNYDNKEDVWDLSDSLAELYEASQAADATNTLELPSKRHKGIDNNVDIKEWLTKDTSNGFIRVYPPDMNCYSNSQIVPCTLSTTAHKICLMMGLAVNALHIQLNGDKVRRLDPYEHPLVLQNEYLAGLGYSDVNRIQTEGAKEELAYLVKFYSGKPMVDSTFSRNQLQAYIDIKKGKVMANWVKRMCVVSGTRLLIYKDKFKHSKPSVIQLAKGCVEEVQGVKGYEMVLRLTSTLEGEKVIFLSFTDQKEYDKWYRKCKKATDKLPTSADLSNCHLEFLPETIFINDQLAMLNLRHNVLKERPIEEDIYTIGWLDDLPKFQRLRSLNLADNNLVTFPPALCDITTLVELNIASNRLEELPPEIQLLINLQALHVHNNHLSKLPMEMTTLSRLFILVLAFNHFKTVPTVVAHMTDVRISEVENIIMAGNRIDHIPPETLAKMKYVKKADFRMNQLTLPPSETVKFSALEHMTHLDIRDNCVKELDIRMLRTLEYLNVERNDMTVLQLNGMALKNLFAAHNALERLLVSPKPEWLLQMDVSYNQLRRLPDWLSDCFFLQKLNASYNLLTDLPDRLLVDAKRLKSLRVSHNKLVALPCEVDAVSLEEIHIQHNNIARLPNELFRKANKLRVFNGTKNRLTMLPELNANTDLNKVQEVYLTGNMLGDSAMETIAGYQRLKVLHIAHNEIHNLYDNDFKKLELLQEINLSGNQLRSLPAVLGTMSKLVILRAHSNILQSLPDFKMASALRILDVGHNQLLNVSVTNLMASQLNLLDMSLNAQLKVDPREFKTVKHRKSVCLVDSSGQNRVLPGLHHRKPRPMHDEYETDPSLPWKVGFSETSGIRNKLCIATLKILKFEGENASLFGMFDGGHNNEVPKVLLDKVPSIMRDEMRFDKDGDKYMKYTMLTAHRKLKEAGQRVGASAALCHIKCQKERQGSSDSDEHLNQYVLKLCNVGDVEVVMCRRGEALCITRKFTTLDDFEECYRVYESDGIITEDNKVNGSTKTTRQLGNSYLYPSVIPDPHTLSINLRHDDEFLIIANRGLWKYISYEDAVEEIYEIGNPVVAAKKLQDMAQGYGSKENVGVLVIRLNTDRGPSLARLRQHKSMSIDDVEAAAAHDAKLLQLQRQRSRDLSIENVNGHSPRPGKDIQNMNGHSPRPVENRPPPLKPERKRRSESVPPMVHREGEPDSMSSINTRSTFHNSSKSSIRNASSSTLRAPSPPPAFRSGSVDGSSTPVRLSSSKGISRLSNNENGLEGSPARTSPLPDLKPLPNQRYRKKNAAMEWEELLQKRLTDDVKDKELKQVSRTVSEESMVSSSSKQLKPFPVDIEDNNNKKQPQHNGMESRSRSSKENIATWRERKITQPPGFGPAFEGKLNAVSLAQAMQDEEELKADLAQHEINSSLGAIPKKNPKKVRNTIALFENMTRSPELKQKSSVVSNPDTGKRTTIVVIERDERGEQNQNNAKPTKQNSNSSLSNDPSKVKVEVQTLELGSDQASSLGRLSTGSGGSNSSPLTQSVHGIQANPQAGSLEANLYASVRKVDHGDNTFTQVTTREDGEVRIVEIARL